MKHLHRLLFTVASAAFFIASSALAQTGTVTSNAFAVGQGPGVQGFASVLCTQAQIAIGQNAAKPICAALSGDITMNAGGLTKITPGPSMTMKATLDGLSITDVAMPVVYPVTPVTKTTIQNAINTACSGPHAIVQIPVGAWTIDTTSSSINVTCGVKIKGSTGSVGGTTGGTILHNNAAANDLFTITTPQSASIENIGMVADVTKSAGTVAVRLNNSSTSESHQVVSDLDIQGFCTSIEIDNSFHATITRNHIYSTTCAGIVVTQPDGPDGGNNLIEDNLIWDVGGTAGANDCILWDRGSGTRVHHNRCLGAFNYGLHVKFDKTFGNDGALLADDNTFEVQKLSGIYLERTAAAQAAGTTIGQMVFPNNFIQSITPGGTGSFNITTSGGSPWVVSCTFTNNTIQNSIGPAFNAALEIDGASDCNIANNTIDGTSGAGGIRVSGVSTNIQVTNNLNPNTPVANRYSLNSGTTVFDKFGVTVATLPTAANGSEIWATDGCPTNPITGGCSGQWAQRIGGAWVPMATIHPPTETRIASGTNAAYTTPAGAAEILPICYGSGGGGGGSAGTTTNGGNGGGGNPSCFGTNATACTSPLVQANGGNGGQGGGQSGSLANPAAGGTGGAAGTGDDGFNGAPGSSAFAPPAANGGVGGAGGGQGGGIGGFGSAGAAGTKPGGGGGGGGAGNGGSAGGAGGGSGERRWKRIVGPVAGYFSTIGLGGTAGAAGTGGSPSAGGVGGPGYCLVQEFYH